MNKLSLWLAKIKRFSLSDFLLKAWVGLVYLFLYIPLVVLTVFSCNNAKFPYRWVGFTTDWYKELLVSTDIWLATKNSFIIAFSAVCLSLLLGLFFVLWNAHYKKRSLIPAFYPNLFVPEIVLAVGLLSFFVFLQVPLGLMTLTVAHTLLGLGYAIPIINARYQSLDKKLIEASLDLGANYRQTLIRVIIPSLRSALLAAGILIFIISLDDFLLAFFCSGSSDQTLSTYIFAMICCGVSPVVNALATLMLVVSATCVIIFCSLQGKARIW